MLFLEKVDNNIKFYQKQISPERDNALIESSIFYGISQTVLFSNYSCYSVQLFNYAFFKCSSDHDGVVFFQNSDAKSRFGCYFSIVEKCFSINQVTAFKVQLDSNISYNTLSNVCFSCCPDEQQPRQAICIQFGGLILNEDLNFSHCKATLDLHFVGESQAPVHLKFVSFCDSQCLSYGLLTLAKSEFYLSYCNFLGFREMDAIIHSYNAKYVKVFRSNFENILSIGPNMTFSIFPDGFSSIDVEECYLDGTPVIDSNVFIKNKEMVSIKIHTCDVKFKLMVCRRLQKNPFSSLVLLSSFSIFFIQ